jgi:uncharacterized DUF497 family protein
MNPAQFLKELKQERLSGREFLALIGNTELSNEDYTEIKSNPSMTYERLVQILENSPISEGEYVRLLKTARERRIKQIQVKKRKELEGKLSAAIDFFDTHPGLPSMKGNSEMYTPATDTASLDNTEEITLTKNPFDISGSAYDEPTGDDLWESADSEPQNTDCLNTPDLIEEFAEFGGSEDFDRSAHRENLAKIIICLTLGVILAVSSFLIRYFGLSDYVTAPQSYEDIFELNSTRHSRTPEQDTEQKLYRAENFTAPANPLMQVAASNRYIFKLIGNTVYSVELDSGRMENSAVFTPNKDIRGLFELQNKLYVIADDSDAVTVYEFNASEFSRRPSREYRIDGQFNRLLTHESGFFVITDYFPSNNADIENPADYIPSYRSGKEESLVDFDNIEFVKEPPYSNMTVIAAIGRENFAVYAVSGNSPDCVHLGQGSLVMSFYSRQRNTSQILRYSIAGSGLVRPTRTSSDITGRVRQGYIDERGDVTRIIADSGDSAVLYTLSDSMRLIGSRLGRIAADKQIEGVAFADEAVYVIALSDEEKQIYAISTENIENPVFLNDSDSLITSDEFHKWNDERFFSVGLDSEDRVVLTMYSVRGNTSPAVEAVYRLATDDEIWYERTRTSVEHLWSGELAVSFDPTSGTGVIVLPVTYFNVSRIESFFVLTYEQDLGFSKIGSIIDVTPHRHNRRLTAIIRNGYIYTVWDDIIKSAMTDSTIITTHSISGENNA